MSIAAPWEIHRARVLPEWIDYNGHMNVAYYVLAFDHAFDVLMAEIGIDKAHREERRGTIFALEGHVSYFQELAEGAPLRFTLQLLGCDAKRIHSYFRMYHGEEGFLAASAEWMSSYVNLDSRKTAPFPPDVAAKLQGIWERHGNLPWPEEAGRGLALPAKRRAMA